MQALLKIMTDQTCMEACPNITYPEGENQIMKFKKLLLSYRKWGFYHWNTRVHLGDETV